MSRTQRPESSSTIFPFLAVLLCTMGTMLVLLVAVAHVSRSKARQEAAAAAAAAEAARVGADSPERLRLERTLDEAKRAADEAQELRAEALAKLAEEQLRLSGAEDHLRRLREETEALTAEAAQLVAVEEQHYDDEKVARQELERLNRLVGEIEDELAKAKFAATGRQRRYAVKPLRDARTGTLRPPTYFECRSTGLVLQPEGIELAWADLAAGDFSSPVAAAQRAVARHYESHPEARAANEVGVPYPLLVVRPDGVHAYYLARTALESAGIDYGYQPVADDWPLEFGAPNPVLAAEVESAVRTARAEREGLARAIPELSAAMSGAAAAARVAVARGGSARGIGGMIPVAVADGNGVGSSGAGLAGGLRVRPADPNSNNPFEGLRIEGSLPGETSGEDPRGSDPADPLADQRSPGSGGASPPPLGAPAIAGGAASGPAAEGPAGVASTPDVNATASSPAPEGAGGAAGAQGGTSETPPETGLATAVAANPLTPDQRTPAAGGASASASGKSSGDPAAAGTASSAPSRPGVPIIRPIRLYVSRTRVAVLPDEAQSAGDAARAASTSQGVNFTGATSAQINELLAVLKRQADSWGIAGDGMYWDPRLVLNVADDGSHRADDVRRMLEAAGVKVQAYPVTTAANPPPVGGPDAKRR